MERSRGVGGVGGFLGIAHDGVGKLVDWLIVWHQEVKLLFVSIVR